MQLQKPSQIFDGHEADYDAVNRVWTQIVAVCALHYVWADTGRELFALGGCCGDCLGYDIGK